MAQGDPAALSTQVEISLPGQLGACSYGFIQGELIVFIVGVISTYR